MRHIQILTGPKSVSLIALSVAAILSSALHAQEAKPAAQSGEIEEVIVSAQKRLQSLQDVPISVTALRGVDIEKRGVEGLTEYTRSVPGLAYVDFGPGGNRNSRPLIIRGVDTSGSDFTAPSVGYYIDEAPISVIDPKLFDLDRIEVLRGPQGTLYGVGTAGGTIKIVTNQPRLDAFEAAAEATLLGAQHGSEGGRFNGMLNVPLATEKAALRLVGFYRDEPGYIDSVEAPAGSPDYVIANTRSTAKKDFNDQRIWGARASLLLKPSERVSITPSVFIQENDIGGEPVHAPETAGELKIARETGTRQSTEFRLYSLNAKFDLGFAELVSVTSHQSNDFKGVEDVSDLIRNVFPFVEVGSPFPIDDERRHTTQEIRLASQGESRLQWLLGAFYQKRKLDLFQGLILPGIDDQTPISIPGDLVAAYDNQIDVREYAGFGELTYDLTPRLHATGGLRYFNIDQTTETLTGGFFFAGGSHVIEGTKEDGVRPKVQLSFDATDDLMIFATAAQGFRLGGVAAVVPDTPACRAGLDQLGISFPVPTSYSADSIWNYELGTKSSWLDRRLVLNASVYYIKRTDVVQSTPIPGDCGFEVTQNAGKASSRGVEVEANAQLLRNLSLALAIGYTDSHLDSNDPSNPQARSGDRLLQIPKWTISAAAEYRRPIFSGMEGFVRSDYQYTGNRPNDFLEGGPDHLMPGFGTLNFRIGVQRDAWSGTLFVDNASDKRPRLSNWSFGHNYGAFHTLTPRTIGFTLRRDF